MKLLKTAVMLCLAVLMVALCACQKKAAVPPASSEIPTVPLRVEEGLTPQGIYNALVGHFGLVGSVLENEGTGPLFQEAQMYTVRLGRDSAPVLFIFCFTDASQAQKALEDFLGQDLENSGFADSKIYQKDNLLAIYTGSSKEADQMLSGMMDVSRV